VSWVPSSFDFLRRFAIACVVVAALTAVGVMAGDAFARKKFEESRKVAVPNLVKADPGDPANYLLIGSDELPANDPADVNAFGSPQERAGKRSDVMMVLHVDPKNRTGLLVSFPRDLVVDIPGHGTDILNAAYGEGGPTLVVDTLENQFPGLKINHYIEVNFKGFQDIVNAIGKVKLYFPTAANDEFTGLHVNQPGCVAVDGAGALAYARSRHYNIPVNQQNPAPWRPSGVDKQSSGWMEDGLADLDRIPRQQYFLRSISQAAIDKTAANPTKLFALLDAVKNSFTRDTTLKFSEMKALIRTFNGLNPARVEMQTLPVAASPTRSGKLVATDAANALIGQLSILRQAPELPKPLPHDQVTVRVVNGSGINQAGQRVYDEFAAAGFHMLGAPEDADRNDYGRTQVRYAPGEYQQAYTTAPTVGTLNMVEAISKKNTLDADVLIIVGRDLDKLNPTSATTTTTGASTSVTNPTQSTTTTTSTVPQSTTSTTPSRTVDTRFVPVDPKTGGPLVGCPK
jgi:LCP family protein required for cell wall assembly